jgi:hypothetical protein
VGWGLIPKDAVPLDYLESAAHCRRDTLTHTHPWKISIFYPNLSAFNVHRLAYPFFSNAAALRICVYIYVWIDLLKDSSTIQNFGDLESQILYFEL